MFLALEIEVHNNCVCNPVVHVSEEMTNSCLHVCALSRFSCSHDMNLIGG